MASNKQGEKGVYFVPVYKIKQPFLRDIGGSGEVNQVRMTSFMIGP